MSQPLSRHRLHPHPSTPAPAVHSLCVDVGRSDTAPGAWWLRFRLQAALEALALPPPGASAGPADDLWRHTCFEAFVGRAQAAAYHEFNFSPAGDWAAYAFSGPRQRASADQLPLTPRLQWQRGDDTLTLTVELPRQALPAADHTDLLLGLSAVIEARDGQLSCWALAHPAPQPDFHHRAGWTARLP